MAKKTKKSTGTKNSKKIIKSEPAEISAPVKKPVKKKILGRDKMALVEQYVREGRKVLVSGSGEKRRYIVFLDGD